MGSIWPTTSASPLAIKRLEAPAGLSPDVEDGGVDGRSHAGRTKVNQPGKGCLVAGGFIASVNDGAKPTFGIPWTCFEIAWGCFRIGVNATPVWQMLSRQGSDPRDQPRFVFLACKNNGYGKCLTRPNTRRRAGQRSGCIGGTKRLAPELRNVTIENQQHPADVGTFEAGSQIALPIVKVVFHQFVHRADAERLIVQQYVAPIALLSEKPFDERWYGVCLAVSFDEQDESSSCVGCLDLHSCRVNRQKFPGVEQLLADGLLLLVGDQADSCFQSRELHDANLLHIKLVKKLRTVCRQDDLSMPLHWGCLEFFRQKREGTGVDSILGMLENQRLLGRSLINSKQVGIKPSKAIGFLGKIKSKCLAIKPVADHDVRGILNVV